MMCDRYYQEDMIMSKQLEALEKQKQQISARIQKAKAVECTKERKKDLRRKVLIG